MIEETLGAWPMLKNTTSPKTVSKKWTDILVDVYSRFGFSPLFEIGSTITPPYSTYIYQLDVNLKLTIFYTFLIVINFFLIFLEKAQETKSRFQT